LKTKIENFLGSRVNLTVVISMDLLSQDLLGRFNIGDIFSDTGSDQAVLEPTIRSFDFAPGLRRKGMDDLDIALLQHLFPLRSRVIGLKVVLIPEGVSASEGCHSSPGLKAWGFLV
jgi:hypothetical protein